MSHTSLRRKQRRAVMWMLAIVALALWSFAQFMVSAKFWYEPKEATIRSIEEGVEPDVSVDRVIHRSFRGTYSVNVIAVDEDTGGPANERPACAGSDTLPYRGGLDKPQSVPLSQWADDVRCEALPAGKYYAEACWTIDRPFWGLVSPKTICINSNVFTVFPRGRVIGMLLD